MFLKLSEKLASKLENNLKNLQKQEFSELSFDNVNGSTEEIQRRVSALGYETYLINFTKHFPSTLDGKTLIYNFITKNYFGNE